MKKYFYLLTILLFFQMSRNLFAQTYGEIITKNEANNLFGEVLESKSISINNFNLIMEKSNSLLMFLIKDGELVIKKEGQTIIYQSGNNDLSGEKFHVFSKSILIDLLNKSTNEYITIERRSDVLSITYGEFTLEYSLLCPPFCD